MSKATEEKFLWFTAGFAAVFVLKYLVFGLGDWNRIYHPERLPCES